MDKVEEEKEIEYIVRVINEFTYDDEVKIVSPIERVFRKFCFELIEIINDKNWQIQLLEEINKKGEEKK